MIIDAGALQAFAGGEHVLARQRLAAELLVHARRAPTRPRTSRHSSSSERGDFLEIGQRHAVGDKARAPMRDRGLEPRIGSSWQFP